MEKDITKGELVDLAQEYAASEKDDYAWGIKFTAYIAGALKMREILKGKNSPFKTPPNK